MSRPLYKLSVLLKHQLKLTKPVIGCRCTYGTSEIKPVTSESKIAVSSSKELYEKLTIVDDPANLIANIEANKEKIDGCHVVAALTSIQKFYQVNQVQPYDVQKNTDFLKICYILNTNLLRLDVPQLLQALKILSLLKVPSSTMIVQSLLQLIRNSINDLNLDQIYFLSFLLKVLGPTHLGDAIHTALPEIFKVQLDLQLDREDIRDLKNALRFASSNINDQNTFAIILDALAEMKITDVDTAKEVLISMCRMKDVKNDYFTIIQTAQEVVANYLTLLKQSEVTNILSNVLKKSIEGDDKFYDPFFIDKLADKMIHDDCGFNSGIYILSKLNKLKHIRRPLLNYLASKIYQDPTVISTCQPNNIVTFVSGLSYANYTPDNWAAVLKTLASNYTRLPHHIPLCYFTLYLASLDYFDSRMIEQIFIADKNPELLTSSYFGTLKKVYQFVKTLCPKYCGPWPMKEIVESFSTPRETKSYPLRHVLEKLFGGAEYVKTNVRTNLGHEIDHLVVVQNGCPIIVERSSEKQDLDRICCVDDLKIPLDSERIAVLVLPPELYGTNIEILEAAALLNIKTLEAMSYRVVPISFNTFNQMPDHELYPYLQNLFGLKCKEKVSKVN